MLIGEILVEKGVCTFEQVEEALAAQVIHGGRVGTNLVELGYVTEEQLADALGKQHGIAAVHGNLAPTPDALALVDLNYCDDKDIVPLKLEGNRLYLLVITPQDISARDHIAQTTGKRVMPLVVAEFRMAQLQRRYCKAFRPVRAVDVADVKRKKQKEDEARKKVQEELMNEDDFSFLYAQAMTGGAAPEELPEAVIVGEELPTIEAEPLPEPEPVVQARPAQPVQPQRPAPAQPARPSQPQVPVAQPPPPRPSQPQVPVAQPQPPRPSQPQVPAAQPPRPSQPQIPVAAPLPQRPVNVPVQAKAAEPEVEIDLDITDMEIAEAPQPVQPQAASPIGVAAPLPQRSDRRQSPPVPVPQDRRMRDRRDIGPDEVTDALSFADAQAALKNVSDRDAIAQTVLKFAMGTFKRAFLFTVQGDLLLGWEAAGKGISRRSAKRIAIPLPKDGQSSFKLVRDSRSHYLGALKKDPGTLAFLRQLGGTKGPKSAILMPILAGGRVVNILYADNGPGEHSANDVGELLILSQKVGRSYEEMINSRKKARPAAATPPPA